MAVLPLETVAVMMVQHILCECAFVKVNLGWTRMMQIKIDQTFKTVASDRVKLPLYTTHFLMLSISIFIC